MANILVCDRCGTKSRVLVQGNLRVDLCHDCAIYLLGVCVTTEQIAERRAEWPNDFPDALREIPQATAGVAVLTDEAKDVQMKAMLFKEHGVEIHRITPNKAIASLPSIIKYGKEQATVQVLAAVPGKPGMYFAKMVL